jgi:putative addiction module component (TIGR02574 family)
MLENKVNTWTMEFQSHQGNGDRMSIAFDLPVDDLSLNEKLQLMERLWQSLSRNPGEIVSPEWHADILADREKAVQEGRSNFVDWEDAKQRLRDRFR